MWVVGFPAALGRAELTAADGHGLQKAAAELVADWHPDIGGGPLLEAVRGYETEMLDYGFAAVQRSLRGV